MQIDIQWLQNNFARFNARYFSDLLPVPRFGIGHSRTRLGTLSYKRKSRMGRSQYSDFAIQLSNYYDQSEHQFQSVLLHEMIHLSIACSGVKDTAPHGVVFRGMMQRLNRDGWNIQVMTSTKGMQKAYTGSATVISQFLVLAIEMHDGRRFLSSVNPSLPARLPSTCVAFTTSTILPGTPPPTLVRGHAQGAQPAWPPRSPRPLQGQDREHATAHL
jgi:hypothetical protein